MSRELRTKGLRAFAILMLALAVFFAVMTVYTAEGSDHTYADTTEQATPVVDGTETPEPTDDAIIQLIIDLLLQLLGMDPDPTPTPTPTPEPTCDLTCYIVNLLIEILEDMLAGVS